MARYDIPSAIPDAVRRIADDVPKLYVRTMIGREKMYGGHPPIEFLQRDAARRMAAELEPYVKHDWKFDSDSYQDVMTSSLHKPLGYAELTSLLSRAYEAGRRDR